MDLDDEELEATRKAKGLLRKKEEDITDWLINRENSIGNSKEIYVRGKKVSKVMEEDIKIVEELRKELGLYADGNKVKQGKAIENLIKRNKELEEENEELKTCKYSIDFYELGKKNQRDRIKLDYIPKSLVEEKIEELDKLIIETQKELGSASKEYTIYVYQKSILQELLKGE